MTSQASVGVTVAGKALAMNLADIAEIVAVPVWTPVPNGPPFLLGLAQLRGAVLPVISLARLLGHAQAEAGRQARLVVMAGGAAFGLLVDGVAALEDAGTGERMDVGALVAQAFGAPGRSATRPHPAREPSRRPGPAWRDTLALVGLQAGGQDYALPLSDVVEIMRLPGPLSPAYLPQVPNADAAMRGVIAFRGGLLPLVCLASLLGMGAAPTSRSNRIVVVTLGEDRLGLVVDGVTGTLIVAPGTIDPVPRVLTRAAGEALLDGICRLDGGTRLVGLLAVARLFNPQTLAQLLATGHRPAGTDDVTETATALEPFILFALGTAEFGLPLGVVDEVVRCPETLTRLPRAQEDMMGLLSLRGRTIPVIDTAPCLGSKADRRARARIIVVSLDGKQVGLAVDRVTALRRLDQSALRAAPALATAVLFDRVAVQHEGKVLLLLSPGALLAQVARDGLAEPAAAILPALT